MDSLSAPKTQQERRGAGYSILRIRNLANSADFLMGISRLARARLAAETSMSVADSILGAAAQGFLNPALVSGSLVQSGSPGSQKHYRPC